MSSSSEYEDCEDMESPQRGTVDLDSEEEEEDDEGSSSDCEEMDDEEEEEEDEMDSDEDEDESMSDDSPKRKPKKRKLPAAAADEAGAKRKLKRADSKESVKSANGKKTPTRKQMRCETIEQWAKWKKEGIGNVPYDNLSCGKDFQVPKSSIPKCKSLGKGERPPDSERIPCQVLWNPRDLEVWNAEQEKKAKTVDKENAKGKDNKDAKKKDKIPEKITQKKIQQWLDISKQIWPIWKRWDTLSSLALLTHFKYDFKKAACSLHSMKSHDKEFATADSKEFDRVCGHPTIPYRNKWGTADVRGAPEKNEYKRTDDECAPWPNATRFDTRRAPKVLGVQTRADRAREQQFSQSQSQKC